MVYRSVLIPVTFFLAVMSMNAGENPAHTPSRLHAAVCIVRGSVSGSNIGSYGPFVRETDSSWRRLSLSNVINFGFGSYTQTEPNLLYLAGGNGVHRSTDDGKTWRILTGWETMEILTVLPHPVDASLVYASTPWGVYRTTDSGRTWASCMTGFNRWYVFHMAFDVRSADVLYATGEDDLYTTTTRGDLWRPMGVGKGAVLAFLQHPQKPDLFVVGCEDAGIQRSTDGGISWNPARCPSSGPVYTFAASSDGTTLYAAGWETGIWTSVDHGGTWEVLWAAENIQTFFSLLVDPVDQHHLYAGTDIHGVYESVDGGRQWKQAGLNGGKIKHLFFYP